MRIGPTSEASDVGAAQLRGAIAKAVPGLDFNLSYDQGSMTFRLDFQRRVEGHSCLLSAEAIAMARDTRELLAAEVGGAVGQIRNRAIADYGLEDLIREREEKAAKRARQVMAQAVADAAEGLRRMESVEVQKLGESVPQVIRVKAPLPYEAQQLVEFANQLAAGRN